MSPHHLKPAAIILGCLSVFLSACWLASRSRPTTTYDPSYLPRVTYERSAS